MKIIIGLTILFHFTSATAREIKVLSMNILFGLDPERLAQTVDVLRTVNADLIGLQEAYGTIPEIATELGYSFDQDSQILSRYPISRRFEDGVVVMINGKQLAFFNHHLQSYPYGPYDLRDGKSVEEVLANENRLHMTEMAPTIERILLYKQKDIPVILTGDMNVPSHLDWTEAAKADHFDFVVQWPLSKRFAEIGLKDSFREKYPIAHLKKGYTWSPKYPEETAVDRIDYVYYLGPELKDSKIVGERGPYSDLTFNIWPSDHRAVLSNFEI